MPFFSLGQPPHVFQGRENWEFKLYGFEEGLSHRNIYSIVQDTAGFLWLGSLRGLNRFDGYGFAVFKKDSDIGRLPEDFVEQLAAGPAGYLIYAHENCFFVRKPRSLDWEAFSLVRRSSMPVLISGAVGTGEERTLPDSLRGFHIDHLLPMPDSSLWMTVHDDRLERDYLLLLGLEGELYSVYPLSGNYARRPIFRSREEILVAGYENELWIFDLAGRWKDKINLSYRGRDKARARILDIRGDRRGRIYLLLQDGRLLVRTGANRHFELHPLSDLLDVRLGFEHLAVDEEGNIWLAASNALVFWDVTTQRLQDLSAEVQKLTRYPPNIRTLLVDASQVVWLATEFGAVKVVRRKEMFQTYLKDGSAWCQSGFCSMRGMAEDESGNVYFSYYNGLHILHRGAERAEPLFPNRHLRIAPFGLAWYDGALFTGGGLRIVPDEGRIDSLHLSLREQEGIPYVDSAHRLWLASGGRLFLWDAKAERFFLYRLRGFAGDSLPAKITAIAEGGRSGRLWLGTRSAGLFSLDVSTCTVSVKEGTERMYVLGIHEGASGLLWLASSEGLVQLDLVSGRLRKFAERQGLPNAFINGLLSEGDTAIWVSTDKGLARFSVLKEQFHVFLEEDGLPANEFNRISFFKDRSGRFFFGGLNGVVAFYPGPQMESPKESGFVKLLLTEFSKYDGRFDSVINLPVYAYGKEAITLTHRDRFFTLSYALAHYANPGNHLFSYRLEGYDRHWSEPTRSHQVRYNNLPAGNYVFKLRAGLGEGRWSQKVLSVPIVVRQAFYKTPWFITFCFVVFVALVYGIMRYRLYLLQQRKKALEEQVQKRTAELREEKRKSDALLLNILPPETAEELKEKGHARARRYEHISVLFLDFQNFTKVAEAYTPEVLVAEIDRYFRAFDLIVEKHGLEKIKTIGDAYMCAGGFFAERPEQGAFQAVEAALDMQAFIEEAFAESPVRWRARIGIHTGPVVAGVVGLKKFAYDIWGDTVNIAARMEACGEVGKVNVSETTCRLVRKRYCCTPRGKVKAKNKGRIAMFFVTRI